VPHDQFIYDFVVVFYVVWWATRIRSCFHRWRQPLLRGEEWFFNVRVQAGFYQGPGRMMLHRYWMRMFIPFALDLPMASVVFIPGDLKFMVWLMLAQAALIHVNHVFSVEIAERQARPLAVAEAEKPVPALLLSLKPRRLRDYSNYKVENAIMLSTTIAIVALIRYYMAAPENHNLRLVFGRAAFVLYAQVGLLLAKRIVVAWRTPVPQLQAEEYLEAREQTRRLYLQVCDWCRITYSLMLLFCPILLYAPPFSQGRLAASLLTASLATGVVLQIWQEIRRKKVLAVSLRALPMKLPELLGQPETLRWPLCYQPSAPMLVLKGTCGYSVNLANTLAQLSAAYIAGLVLLLTVLPTGH
jgi:hypothetical protein